MEEPPEHTSGIFLFVDRQNITHFFAPNFLPPYDGEKRQIILNFLKEEWDQTTLSWKPVGETTPEALDDDPNTTRGAPNPAQDQAKAASESDPYMCCGITLDTFKL